jgi:DNA-binding MarR family transcriptional regulator
MDTVDRRKFLIRLTPAGQQKLDDVMPDYHQKIRALMTTLNMAERDAMVDSVKKLAANIDVMK